MSICCARDRLVRLSLSRALLVLCDVPRPRDAMRFGNTLKNSTYAPWKDHYVDYLKLKRLLREHETGPEGGDSEDGGEPQAQAQAEAGADADTGGAQWTEEDEETFVQELVNVQLDKVNAFQVETYRQLLDRTAECENKLEPLTVEGEAAAIRDEDERRTLAEETLRELDSITTEVSELEKFSRINFTGFLKAAKKHDRKRGARYKVRPLLQVRLSQLPFNSEDYSPILYRLSAMYSFVRQVLHQAQAQRGPSVDVHLGEDAYKSSKFWVHPDNIMEVKTLILRQLPVLVYNPSTSKDLDMAHRDPTITSLYFDSRGFDLYGQKVAKAPEAGSLRLRWTGRLNEKPEIFLEKKTIGDGEDSREVRIRVKAKHIRSFLSGDYKMEKILHRMESRDDERAATLRRDIEEIQEFIHEQELEPMVRATYTRAAFQIPGDDRIRISLDTDLALIREDALDPEHPCRDPNDWHRHDIDDQEMEYPFSWIDDDKISRFPYALLDIKVRGGNGSRANKEWVNDLMASHLVKEAPRFSKFVHGVAELFEDQVNSFPFWLSELDTDIRRDPQSAFQEEQEKIAKRAEEEMAVGSFLGRHHPKEAAHSPTPKFEESPMTRMMSQESLAISPPKPSEPSRRPSRAQPRPQPQPQPSAEATDTSRGGLRSLLPKFSTSRYALRHRHPSSRLPPGVRHPGTWMKNAGPVRVEAKVWLANQRTFIKWQHICVLLAALSLGLYNSASAAGSSADGSEKDNGDSSGSGSSTVARALALVYTCFAIFAGCWGWAMYVVRARLIRARSGRDLDNVFGPFVLCVGLAVALVLNFWLKVGCLLLLLHTYRPFFVTF